MKYFIKAFSFAAPHVSDVTERYLWGLTPEDALERFAAEYEHPEGLYCAGVWRNADSCANNDPYLAAWKSNRLLEREGVIPITDEPRAGRVTR